MPQPDLRYSQAHFLVEIDNIPKASFSEVTGLTAELEVIEYREGGDINGSVRKVQGLRKFSDLTLRRGMTTDL
ncbi:MAG: phage tail protein, partial [Acidobacteriales bacterium]|nr:phage tail protein [Terriglobales bacterium]